MKRVKTWRNSNLTLQNLHTSLVFFSSPAPRNKDLKFGHIFWMVLWHQLLVLPIFLFLTSSKFVYNSGQQWYGIPSFLKLFCIPFSFCANHHEKMSCKKDIAIAMHSGAFVSVNMLPVFPGNIHGTGFFLSIAGHMSCWIVTCYSHVEAIPM